MRRKCSAECRVKTPDCGKMSLIILLLSLLYPRLSWSHGRLIEPPSRSTMWRYGFNNPPNYNDHEGYCGGFTRQWQTNRGRCGICGDPWDQLQVSVVFLGAV